MVELSHHNQLLITGLLSLLVIVSLIVFVNSHPLTGNAVAYTRSPSYATSQYPCTTLKGYCFNEHTNSVCSYKPDGWCPKQCVCRIY